MASATWVFVWMKTKPSLALPVSALFFAQVLALLAAISTTTVASDDHSGHSDDLLLLIQAKLQLQKLQRAYADTEQPLSERQRNLEEQRTLLNYAITRLQHYVAISAGHYANDALYQQSLENRAAMLKDFTALLLQYQQQWQPQNPDKDQHHPHSHSPQ